MQELNFETTDYIPLCDLLKSLGLCPTGGHAKAVIADGQVEVDGEIELRKRCKIKAGQVVVFDNHKISVAAKKD